MDKMELIEALSSKIQEEGKLVALMKRAHDERVYMINSVSSFMTKYPPGRTISVTAQSDQSAASVALKVEGAGKVYVDRITEEIVAAAIEKVKELSKQIDYAADRLSKSIAAPKK